MTIHAKAAEQSSAALDNKPRKPRRKLYTVLGAGCAVTLALAGGIGVWVEPRVTHGATYSDYTKTAQAYKRAAADAASIRDACDADEKVTSATLCEDARSALKRPELDTDLKRLSSVPFWRYNEIRAANASLRAETASMKKDTDVLLKAIGAAQKDLERNTAEYRPTADKAVAAQAERVAPARDALNSAEPPADTAALQAALKEFDTNAAAYAKTKDDAHVYAADVKAAQEAVTKSADDVAAAYDAFTGAAANTAEAEPTASNASVSPGGGGSYRTSSGGSSSSRASSSGGGRSSSASPGGGSSSPAPSSGSSGSSSSGGGSHPSQEWHDGSVFTEWDPSIAEADGSFCTEVQGGMERQVPCE